MQALVLLLAAGAIGCTPDTPEEYIRVGGGGFVFNYRIAEATAGVVAEPARTLEPGTVIEATFEDPAGGDPIVVAKQTTPDRKRYSFVTPPLDAIEADRTYRVTVRVLDTEGTVLQTVDYNLRSEIDQSILPEKPLTIGPGYTRNPEAPPLFADKPQGAVE
ncbi:hypothetical protein [Bauldia sp.]|uniref:hypothetical protein n=1 Tax=Bauldia sp. TaxID=2575872 RepID=UPI003BACD92D